MIDVLPLRVKGSAVHVQVNGEACQFYDGDRMLGDGWFGRQTAAEVA